MTNLNRKLPPASNPVQPFTIIQPVTEEYKNGLKLFCFDGSDQDLVRIEWIFENQYREGIAPLAYSSLSALLMEGTRHRNHAEIVDMVDFYGAFLVPEFSFDTTSLSLYCLNKHLSTLLPLVREILTEACFPEKEFNTYIRNSKQKLEISLQKNDFVARRNFYNKLFGNTRYGQLSSPEAYGDLDIEQIRSLYALQFKPQYCTIVIAGKVANTTLKLMKEHFEGDWQTETKDQFRSTFDISMIEGSLDFPQDPAGIFYSEKPGALQSAIRIGCRSIGRTHADFPKLQFLNTLLGGYFGSRLMLNIREDKGFTYGIGSGILSLKNGAFWTIATEVGVDVTQNTLDEIEKEIILLKTELVSSGELELVRNYMLGSLLGSLENIFSHADKFKNAYFNGLGLDYYDQYQDIIQHINSEQILLLANQYLDFDGMSKIVVGKMN